MFSLHGKNAFITGAAGGIGRAVAERFTRAGANVVISDILEPPADLARFGAGYVRVDVACEESVRAGFEAAQSRVGRLDIVVNNAGIGDIGWTMQETPKDTLERITRINQWGVFYGLKHGPEVMNDGGAIINTASLAAQLNMAGSGAYSATKAAVVSMTGMSAVELGGRRIRVNAICPGYIETGMGSGEEGRKLAKNFTALERVGTTEDLVGVFHFLAADESSYITGQAIVVDGGWICGPSKRILESVLGNATVS
jgi:NAD(P)-dependent dehydrogenase (short-subunit alcohol dehydrogenase family)